MKRLLLLCMFLSVYVNGQTKFNAKTADFSELKSRPLIVVVEDDVKELFSNLKKDYAKIKNEGKRKEKLEAVEKYEESINHFNTVWPRIIKENWSFNKEIIVKTRSEFKKIKESNSTKYAVLLFKNLSKTVGSMREGFGTMRIERLFYTKIENIDNKMKKADYFAVFQDFIPQRHMYNEATYKLNAILMQKHMSEIEKMKDEKYVFRDFAKDSKKRNCSSLKGSEVLIYTNTLYKMARKNPNKSFTIGTIKSVEKESVAKAILNEDDTIVGVPCFSHIKANVSIYFKILVNTKTFEIVSCTGINSINEFLRTDLKKLNNCE